METNLELRKAIEEVVASPEFCQTFNRMLENHIPAETTTVTRRATPPVTTPTRNSREQAPIPTIRAEIQRLFPSVARSSSSTTTGQGRQGTVAPTIKKRKYCEVYPKFSKDIVLVRGNREKTLTGKEKIDAFNKGYGLLSVEFKKKWNAADVVNHLQHIFGDKLGTDEIEFLIPMARYLVKPNLMEGQTMDGETINRLYIQKCIYIRPKNKITENAGDIESTQDVFELSFNEKLDQKESPTNPSPVSEPLHRMNNDIYYIDLPGDEDTNFLAAVQNSLAESNTNLLNDSPKCLKSALEALNKNLIDEDKVSIFNVFREEVFECCVRSMSRKKFSPNHKMSVRFTCMNDVAEIAIDAGGPTRELFRLAIEYIRNSRMFQATDAFSKNIILCSDLLHKRYYFYAGQLISMSFVHGGSAPNFFSKTLFSCIVHGVEETLPDEADLVDQELKDIIQVIREESNLEQLNTLILENPLMSVAGCSIISRIDDKKQLIDSLVKFHVIHRHRPALDQLMDGLHTFDMHNLIKEYSKEMEKLLCYVPDELTAESVKKFFKPILSETGSNKRRKENKTLAFFWDYLTDCETQEIEEVQLKDILIYASGLESVPPLGYENPPSLNFLHDDECPYPKANTCAIILSLPVVHSEYNEFKTAMSYGLVHGIPYGTE